MRQRSYFFTVFITLILCIVLVATFVIGSKIKSAPDNGVLEVHFADVGQGDGIVIRTADTVVVIDAGPQSDEFGFTAYLKRMGITEIDLFIITHPHSDHTGGAVRVISSFEVKEILFPKCDGEGTAYMRISELASEKGITVGAFDISEVYTFGLLSLTPLAPIGDGYDGYNDYSTVIRLDFEGISFMLSGDAELTSEKEMLQSTPAELLDCDVLKVGHHGSNTSSSNEFLSAVTPQYAVISCGKGNEFGHPKKDILSRLSSFCGAENVYRTDVCGSVVFVYDGSELEIRTDG